jgi:hypothetical protein
MQNELSASRKPAKKCPSVAASDGVASSRLAAKNRALPLTNICSFRGRTELHEPERQSQVYVTSLIRLLLDNRCSGTPPAQNEPRSHRVFPRRRPGEAMTAVPGDHDEIAAEILSR